MDAIRSLAVKHALLNAVKYGGRAQVKPVVAKVLGERPEYRSMAGDVVRVVEEVVEMVNAMSLEEQLKMLGELWPEALQHEERVVEERRLPPLSNAEVGKVVTRFAPNPDFVLHLGSARPAIISYEYSRMYRGRFILRFEDTDPKTKRPLPEAYDMIREDLKWLGIRWDEEYIQSLHMEVYYKHARELIERGGAYVCTCPAETVRRLRAIGERCACSKRALEAQLDLWDRMVAGEFGEGEAVLRVVTDPHHPDPSVRDWIAFRIIDTAAHPHPLVGDRYVAWPTYNFACGVDDHNLGVTHIFRGKEHESNTVKQRFLYGHFGWSYPTAIHFGRLGIEGTILSKSKIRKRIEDGYYGGLDDPRLATLKALRRRGIVPEAIWELILQVGVKTSAARISLANLHAINRKYVEPRANRYMFVPDPVPLTLAGAVGTVTARIPVHPSHPERGVRTVDIQLSGEGATVFISGADAPMLEEVGEARLLGLANIRLVGPGLAEISGFDPDYAKEKGLAIIQWCPPNAVDATVVKAEGDELREVKGLAEPAVEELRQGDHAQFFRFGFVVLEDKNRRLFIFSHD